MSKIRNAILMIDGENVSYRKLAIMFAARPELLEGSVTRRVYMDYRRDGRGWAPYIEDWNLQVVDTPHQDYEVNKNLADMILSVDAIELLFTQQPDALILASSDSDFLPMIRKYRERGVEVIVLGNQGHKKAIESHASSYLTPQSVVVGEDADAHLKALDLGIDFLIRTQGVAWVSNIPAAASRIFPGFDSIFLQMPLLRFLRSHPEKYVVHHNPERGPTALSVTFTNQESA